MPRRRAPRRPIEFSKAILAAVSLLTLGVTIFSCALMWHIGDTSALAYLIPAAFAELAAATGFYYNKAKAENQIKLKQQYGHLTDDGEE